MKTSHLIPSAMHTLVHYFNSLVSFDDKDQQALCTLFTESLLEKGTYFSKEGMVANQLAFLTQGVARGYFRNVNGVEYNEHFFVPNEVIAAYSSLISNKPSRISIQALTECKILVADYPSIVRLYDQHPKIERMFKIIAEKLYLIKEKREIEIVMMDAGQRYMIFQNESPSIEGFIPQYHIASYLGITPTQLSRIRSKRR